MENRLDTELEITRGEKALAAVLAVFVMVGLLWAYSHVVREPSPAQPTAVERAAIDANTRAWNRLSAAREHAAEARGEAELARERYRTALDADQPAAALERAYRSSERAFAGAQREVRAAEAGQAATVGPAAAAQQRLAHENQQRSRDASRTTLVLRLLLVLGAIAFAQLAVVRLRGSRLHPLAIATLLAAALLALVMGGDYVTDYVDWTAGGPLVLALAGTAMTVVAFLALQRVLARRLPFRRARKSQCASCGYPVRGTPRCEGCGRAIAAPCSSCEEPRRVGTPHCGACGAA